MFIKNLVEEYRIVEGIIGGRRGRGISRISKIDQIKGNGLKKRKKEK